MNKKNYKMPEGEHYAPVTVSFLEDKQFSIEAKCIYVYLWTHAGIAGYISVPVEKMCYDLNISRNRFYRHVKELKDSGYLTCTKVRSTSTGNYYNRYQLHDPTNAYNFDNEANLIKRANNYRKEDFKRRRAYEELEPYPAFMLNPVSDPEIDELFDKHGISHT